MAHYAKVLNKTVQQVIVAEPEFFETFVDNTPGEWIQTSYNTHGGKHYTELENGEKVLSQDQSKSLRYNFASIGSTYDSEKDAFIPPQPFPSWILNEDTCLWECPVEYPNDGSLYDWNEENQSWDLVSE